MLVRFRLAALLAALPLTATVANAQVANDQTTQAAILQALPEGRTPDDATADEIAEAALNVALNMEGTTIDDLQVNVTQVMISLGELTREGTFRNAPRFGNRNPTGRLYTLVLNLASSALDVTYTTYHGVTVQHIIGLTAAMREGQNFLNGAQSNAITRN